jgi:prolipoprotein diacylglyceryltransferase
LYSSFTAFMLAVLLVAYYSLPHMDGRVFALMMMLEGPARFMLEMLRVEPAVATVHVGSSLIGLSLSMILGAGIFVAGVVMWVMVGFLPGKKAEGFPANAAKA